MIFSSFSNFFRKIKFNIAYLNNFIFFNFFNDCVVLSTAHPCKFPDATKNAINKHEKLPEELQYVLDKDENFQVLKNKTEEVKKFVKSNE